MNVRKAFLTGGILSTAIVATAWMGPQPARAQSGSSNARSASAERPLYFLPDGQQRSIHSAPRGTRARRRIHPGPPRQVSNRSQIRQVHQVQAAPQETRQESAVQRELRRLYNRNGLEMPPMDLDHVGNPHQQPRISAQGRDISRRKPHSGMPMPLVKRTERQPTAGEKAASLLSRLKRATRVQTQSNPLDFLRNLNPFAKEERKVSRKRPIPIPPRGTTRPTTPHRRQTVGTRRPHAAPVTTPPPRRLPKEHRVVPYHRSAQTRQRPKAPTPPPSQRFMEPSEQKRVAAEPTKKPTVAQPRAFPKQPAPFRSIKAKTNAKRHNEDDVPVLFDESTTEPGQTNSNAKQQPVLVSGEKANPFPTESEAEADGAKTGNTAVLPSAGGRPIAPLPPVVKDDTKSSGEQKADNPFENLQPPKVTGSAVGDGKDGDPFVKTDKDNPAVNPGPAPKLKIYSTQDIDKRYRATGVSDSKDKTIQPKPSKKAVVEKDAKKEKMERIIARRGLSGFRGFCPVVLRDRRDLADGQPEHHAKFEGRTYFFSSDGAKATFLRSPKKYAPVKMGLDVVRLSEGGESVEGSLEHAAWYKDRLYFFTSATTLRIFVRTPRKFVESK